MLTRAATARDKSCWAQLCRALWPDCTLADSESDFARIPSQPGRYESFVAAHGNRLMGFLEASLRDSAPQCRSSPVGFFEGWYVQPEYRKSVIGRALVEAVERWAIVSGCTAMASDALLRNKANHRAHHAIGYEEVERLVCFREEPKHPALRKRTSARGPEADQMNDD